MAEHRERRPEDYERDFADLVSGLELDEVSSYPTGSAAPPSETAGFTAGEPEDLRPAHRRTRHPQRDWFNLEEAVERTDSSEPERSEWTPEPLPELNRPALPSVVGWLCFAFSLGAVLVTLFGVRLPGWMGIAAVLAFVASIAILIWRLPNKPDSDGNGAVV
ncbi:hypothetical protein [Granulicoccus phenolivorans]|uniref:hypothetical protein n=1 Tax=Granulicoccus phenolivorans TaxID=266854 RepID=UPI00041F1D1D|nr:hypothetical protein [Granulicoccus phenolivorans]